MTSLYLPAAHPRSVERSCRRHSSYKLLLSGVNNVNKGPKKLCTIKIARHFSSATTRTTPSSQSETPSYYLATFQGRILLLAADFLVGKNHGDFLSAVRDSFSVTNFDSSLIQMTIHSMFWFSIMMMIRARCSKILFGAIFYTPSVSYLVI